MTISRRTLMTSAMASALPMPLVAQERPEELLELQWAALGGSPTEFRDALVALQARNNPDMASSLIIALRFSNGPRKEIATTLRKITGAKVKSDSWFDWMLWQEANPQIKPHPTFAAFKKATLTNIDPAFDIFLKDRYIEPNRMKIRLEEITWGGVRKDGIPSLDNPRLISAEAEDYMRDDDLVFGVSINGDTRAYPLRIMGWHEMFNEVIGGVPVALAYCTLCGSGILFETKVAGRSKPFIFGSSGFLYRSNKLMFDRETHSLWNQFTGKPVVGPLVDTSITLNQRPVVITEWSNWRASNPSTKILSLNTGHRRDYGSGVVYNEYFASSDLMFPTNVDQRQAFQKDFVFGIRQFGGAKAWPLNAFRKRKVINDDIQGNPVVLIGDDDKEYKSSNDKNVVVKISIQN